MPQDFDDDDEDQAASPAISADVILSYFTFIGRALKARKFKVVFTFVAIAGLGLSVLAAWPRTFHTETKLMAQGQISVDREAQLRNFDPLHGAYEVVMRRENLAALVKSTDLAHQYLEHRPALIRFKDAVLGKIRGVPSEKDLEPALVAMLESRVGVSGADGTLTISADWQDGATAVTIVDVAKENFLESRRVAEITTISEYIAILEGHAVKLRGEITSTADKIQEAKQQKFDKLLPQPVAATPGKPAPPRFSIPKPKRAEPDDQLMQLKAALEGKKRAISDLEESRTRRIVEIQNKLEEESVKYTQMHPVILNLKQNLLSLKQPSPQVASLQAEVKALEEEIRTRQAVTGESGGGSGGVYTGGGLASAEGGSSPATPLPAEIMRLMQEDTESVDPVLSLQLRYSIDKYATLLGQVAQANIELAAAQATFVHRYKVIYPAEIPPKAIKPKVPVIAALAIVAGLLISLIGAVVAELRSGKIVGKWQVHHIGLPILAELRLPPRPSSD